MPEGAVKRVSYREYLIAATQEVDLRFAVVEGGGAQMPSGKRGSEVQGKIDKLWIGSLILVVISLIGLTNILWNVAAHH